MNGIELRKILGQKNIAIQKIGREDGYVSIQS